MSGIQWTLRDYLYVTAECAIGVLSLLGNVLVLLAIKKTRTLRTPTNCFIGSLAAADVLVGLIIPPTVVLSYLGLPKDFLGCVFVNSVVVLITNISILNLLAVALERFIAVKSPFFYQRVISVKRALFVVAVTWVIAILIGLIPLLGWHNDREGFTVCAFTIVIDLRYMVYLIFFGMTIPLLLAMLIIYLYIFHIIRIQRKRTNQFNYLTREMRHDMRHRKREAKGAKGLAYVIILFAVCWLPVHIMNCLTVFAPEKSAPFEWLLVAIILSHANSVVNPFFYAFSNSKFKYAMKRILCCGRGQPDDFDSIGEGTSRKRKDEFTSKEGSTLSVFTVTGTASMEPLYHKNDQLSTETPTTDITTVSAMSLNGSAPKQKVCNGSEHHSEKSPVKYSTKQEVTDVAGKDGGVAETIKKRGRRPTVTFTTDRAGLTSSGLWMTTPSSQNAELELEQIHTHQRQQMMRDYSLDQHSCGEPDKLSMTIVDIVKPQSEQNSQAMTSVDNVSANSEQNSLALTSMETVSLKSEEKSNGVIVRNDSKRGNLEKADIYHSWTVSESTACLPEKEKLASETTNGDLCREQCSVGGQKMEFDSKNYLTVHL